MLALTCIAASTAAEVEKDQDLKTAAVNYGGYGAGGIGGGIHFYY